MEKETRSRARDALKRIFTAAGFEAEEPSGGADLTGVGDGLAVVVLCSDDPEEIERFDQTDYLFRCGSTEEPCTKIVFTLRPAPAVSSCIVWGVDDFVRRAGEAAIADVLNRRLILDLAPAPVPPAETEPAEEVPAEPEPEEDEEEEWAGPEVLHVPPRVTEKRARGIAGVEGPTLCRFIPCWQFHITVSGEKEFRDRQVTFESEETGCLNAVNGTITDSPPTEAIRAPVPARGAVVPPRIDEEEARETVISAITDRLSRRVRVRYEKGDAVFYEDRVLAPDEDHITAEFQLVHLPVWQIRGAGRIVEVDGSTGEILRKPMDEGVEVF